MGAIDKFVRNSASRAIDNIQNFGENFRQLLVEFKDM